MERREDRLHPGAAESVDGLTRDGDREARTQERHTRHVAVVLACLIDTAEQDVVDRRGVDTGAFDQGFDGEGGSQPPAVTPDRSPYRVYDPRFTHVSPLES